MKNQKVSDIDLLLSKLDKKNFASLSEKSVPTIENLKTVFYQ